METYETSVLLCLVILTVAGVPILALVLMYRQTKILLRISCAHLGLAPDIMESEKPEEEKPAPKKERKVIMSVPLPGASLFRKVDDVH